MKRFLLLIVLSLSVSGCAAQQFEDVEPTYSKEIVLPMVVGQIKNGTAWLYTENFKVKYEVDLEKFEIGKKYVFKLYVDPRFEGRGGKAKIVWFRIHPDQARLDIVEMMDKNVLE